MNCMKRLTISFVAAFAALAPATADDTLINIYNKTYFMNGWAEELIGAPIQNGVTRHTNYLHSIKLADEDLDRLGDSLSLEAYIHVQCDNYDRLANLNLAFVPKGAETYDWQAVDRIELARFITPFMRLSRQPDTVPYMFDDAGLSMLLRDKDLRAEYDFWLEYECFGVPQTYVGGCSLPRASFAASLDLRTNEPAGPSEGNVLVPIVMKKSEYFGPVNFNNYREVATDTIGVTTKTWRYEVPEDLTDARIVLITSNHGANLAEDNFGNLYPAGEEYNHRRHLTYVDGEIKLDYTPGGVSCEPYRKYNTMTNGIYSTDLKEDMDFWLNYSNWCPGGPIPVRHIELGAVKAGNHELMIRVPDAQFVDNQGDFYVSAYLHGVKSGQLPSSVEENISDAGFTFTRDGNTLILSGNTAEEAAVYSYDGRLLYGLHNPGDSISLDDFDSGIYIVSVRAADGRASVVKFVK